MKKELSSLQVVDYSAAMLYLMVVKAIGIDDGDKIMAQMRNTPSVTICTLRMRTVICVQRQTCGV